MTPEDVPSARALLNSYLERFNLWPDMNDEEFAHWLLPRPGVINSYVICDDKGKVTDMCSFYHLTSTVIKNDQNPKLYAVYSFYNVATSIPLKVSSTGSPGDYRRIPHAKDVHPFSACCPSLTDSDEGSPHPGQKPQCGRI